MLLGKLRAALGVAGAIAVVAVLLSVRASYLRRERAYWQQVRSRTRLESVDLVQWHPTRPELLGTACYQDRVSLAPLEQRLVSVDLAGNLHFLTTGHSDLPYGWSPDGKRVLFARQRRRLSRRDLELWTARRGAAGAADREAREQEWRHRAYDQELALLDAAGHVRRLNPGPPAACLLHAVWLGADEVAATVTEIDPPFRGWLRIWVPLSDRRPVSQELLPGFLPVVLCCGPGGRLAMEGGVSDGAPARRLRSAVCVRGRDARWREVELSTDIVNGALQWLAPPARALVTRRYQRLASGDGMGCVWIDSETLGARAVTVPGLAGWVYKGGRWSPSGDAVALTAVTLGPPETATGALVLWRRAWSRPRIVLRAGRLASVVWSPDGRRLAVVEGGTKVRFVEAP